MSEKMDEEAFAPIQTTLDLNSNVQALIKNPLAGIPRAQLLRNVEEFAKMKDLTDALPILYKGAIRELSMICINMIVRSLIYVLVTP
jgi:pyoverdine/dityrosine biosynthesis protein Dit1